MDNWKLIVKEYGPLIGKRYKHKDKQYFFFGLVYGDDDYYYGMHPVDGHGFELLSCVGTLEAYGFELEE